MDNKVIKLNKTSHQQWMVVYTRSRFEKKIDRSLKEIGITSFCPTIKTKNKWADRIKVVESPLFPSYLFVKVSLSEQTKIRQTAGVLNFVFHCGKAVTLKDSEIERISAIVNNYENVEVNSTQSLNIGDKVKIKDGLLLNYQGVVRQVMGKSVLMAIEQLDCVLTVKVGFDQVSLNVAS
ncbi:UpxY family transcription antiterminator [Mucilaginibacter gynuensis]|uniref:UpxY family transcription antiterminator n=1 Tax=Mucilaginibacter gynuensis TaxID=1302236 RepID=A0ABP8G3E7_9SPHI